MKHICADIAGARGRFVAADSLEALILEYPNAYIHEVTEAGEGFIPSLAGFAAEPSNPTVAADIVAHGFTEITPTFNT
jgi:hypothetical protein